MVNAAEKSHLASLLLNLISSRDCPGQRGARGWSNPTDFFHAACEVAGGAWRIRQSKADSAALAPSPMAMTICL